MDKKRKGKSNTVGMKEAEYEKNIKQDNDKSLGENITWSKNTIYIMHFIKKGNIIVFSSIILSNI